MLSNREPKYSGLQGASDPTVSLQLGTNTLGRLKLPFYRGASFNEGGLRGGLTTNNPT